VASVYGAGAAVASPLGGYLADHVGRRATMAGALLFGGLGMIALGFARDLWVIAPATFFVALLGECYRPAMQAAIADLGARARPRAGVRHPLLGDQPRVLDRARARGRARVALVLLPCSSATGSRASRSP
jgi:MFS family permease